MYSFRHGIVDVEGEGEDQLYYFIPPDYSFWFYPDGRMALKDTYPTLVSLEYAQKLGFVRVSKRTLKPLRYKYTNSEGVYGISSIAYTDYEDIPDTEKKFFVSFVDDKLNECAPPLVTIEWEEIDHG